jgi:hypothetical protein
VCSGRCEEVPRHDSKEVKTDNHARDKALGQFTQLTATQEQV